MENLDEISKSVQSLHFSDANDNQTKKENTQKKLNFQIPQKLMNILVYVLVGATIALLTLLIMVALHFYANTSQNGIFIMLKSVAVAVATDLVL